MMDVSNEMRKLIFVGGAGRSGTSLLCWLVDWHPEVLVFPGEVPVLQRYWAHKTDGESYFSKLFFEPSEGKQASFFDARLMKERLRRLTNEFDLDVEFWLDTAEFKNTYLSSLKQLGKNLLRRVFEGLATGLADSHPEARRMYSNRKNCRLLFKYPYYTELYAREIARLIPGCKFIHLMRSPIDRYVSAKMRRIRNGKCSTLNEVDFCVGHTETWISSANLARDNLKELGEQTYKIVRYEKLLTDTESEVRSLADWLGIEYEDSLLRPTLLGSPMRDNSSFEARRNSGALCYSDRREEFDRFTSLSERTFIYYMLGVNRDLLGDYMVPEVGLFTLKVLRLFPFRFEQKGDYWSRIARRMIDPTIMEVEELRTMLLGRLPALARKAENNIELS